MMSFENFCTVFSTIQTWIKLGWTEIPKVNGKGYREFDELCAILKKDHIDFITDSGDWFKHAVEIENQELIRINKRFVKDLVKCKNLKDIEAIWNVRGNGRNKKGAVKFIESRFDETVPYAAYAVQLEHLCTWLLPSSLQVSSVAGIYTLDKWFTEGHIEVNGEDSIAVIPFGTKLFIYAAGITASRWLLKAVINVPSFMALAMNGPPEEWKRKLFFCIPKSTSVIAQPSFWAHAVLTVQGPSFILGWEAGSLNEEGRLRTVQFSFARGLGMEAQNAIRNMTEAEQMELVPGLPGDVGECLRAQAVAGSLVNKPAKRSRKSRVSHLPGPQRKKEKRLQEHKGYAQFFFVKRRHWVILYVLFRF